jgi:hypothetical protein
MAQSTMAQSTTQLHCEAINGLKCMQVMAKGGGPFLCSRRLPSTKVRVYLLVKWGLQKSSIPAGLLNARPFIGARSVSSVLLWD